MADGVAPAHLRSWTAVGVDVFEHASEMNAVVLVLGVALLMVLAGMAKKQLVWRPREHRRLHCFRPGYAGGSGDDKQRSAS
jgi:hypothetical protein